MARDAGRRAADPAVTAASDLGKIDAASDITTASAVQGDLIGRVVSLAEYRAARDRHPDRQGRRGHVPEPPTGLALRMVSAMTAVVEALAVQAIGKGALKAVVTLRVGAFVLYGVKLLQPDGGAPYMALPQVPVRKGGSGWTAVIDVTSPRLLDRMREVVLQAWLEAQP